MSEPLSLQRLFAGGGEGLERLLARARVLAEFDRRLRRHLPPSIVDQVAVANFRDGVLVLRTSAAEWRNRIHFLAPQIIEALRADSSLPKVTEIRIRVAPVSREVQPRKVNRKLSASAADALLRTAQSFGDDELGQALSRLASRRRGGG